MTRRVSGSDCTLTRGSEAVPVTGGIALELLEIEDQKVKQGGGGGRRSPAGRSKPRGKAVKAKRKKDKIKRKVTRTRR